MGTRSSCSRGGSLAAGRRVWAALLAGPCLSGPIAAQDMELTPTQVAPTVGAAWQIQSFLDDARITGRFVFQADFERDGTGWFATAGGLLAYDGYTWKAYTTAEGLPSDFVRCVLVASDGTVWAGTREGVAALRGGTRFTAPDAAQLAGPNVRRIVEDPDGTLWFCSDTWGQSDVDAGLTALRDGRWHVYRSADGLPNDYIMDYFRSEDGTRYVLTLTGLAAYPPPLRQDGSDLPAGEAPWQRPLESTDLAGIDACFWSIVESPATGVVAMTRQAAFIFRDGEWTRRENPIASRYPKALRRIGDDIVVIEDGSRKQFGRWTDAGIEPLSDSFSMTGSAEHLAAAPDGATWCVGYDLLIRWAPTASEWTEYRGIPPPVLADRNAGVWFADSSRTLRFADGRWSTTPGPIEHMSLGTADEVWGWSGGRITRFEGQQVAHFGPETTGVNLVHGHTVDRAGRNWFHGASKPGQNVLSVHADGQWTLSSPPELRYGTIVASAADPEEGILYLVDRTDIQQLQLHRATVDGVTTLDLPDITLHNPPMPRPGIHIDGTNTLRLFGSFGMYVRTADGGWETASETSQSVVSIAAAGSGLWFDHDGMDGGASGLAYTGPAGSRFIELATTQAYPSPHGDAVLFTTRSDLLRTSGAAGSELAWLTPPVDEPVSAAVHVPGGDIWLEAGERVLHFRPDGVPPRTTIAGSHRELVRNEPLMLALDGTERNRPHGSGALMFSWRVDTGPWSPFERGGQIEVAEMLEPGLHAIEVRARDEGLDVDPRPARLAFRVHPVPLQERAWFWPVVLLAFLFTVGLGVVALISRGKLARLSARLEERVRQRTAGLRDSMTREQKARDATRALESQLAHMGRVSALGELASGLAHELNQPLTSIANDAEVCRNLLRATGADSGEIDSLMEGITDQTMRAGQIIQRLRSMVRPSGTQRTEVSVSHLAADVLRLCERDLRSHGITMSSHIEDAMPAVVADPIQIQQVILNLVLNAAEAMRDNDNGVRQLTIETEQLDSTVEITIRDTGGGLPFDDPQRVFEPFVTTKENGLGMGLAISQSIIKAHGGDIRFESSPQGTTVRVALPTDPA